jgi:hypothetical protein
MTFAYERDRMANRPHFTRTWAHRCATVSFQLTGGGPVGAFSGALK